MSYARFIDYDVYVFFNSGGWLECCGCSLGDNWRHDSTQSMVDHLAEHRAAGHRLPDDIDERLWEDDRENWIDYERCDLPGCDERVQCFSPVPGGSVSACSINHGRQVHPDAFRPARILAGDREPGVLQTLEVIEALITAEACPRDQSETQPRGTTDELGALVAWRSILRCCMIPGSTGIEWSRTTDGRTEIRADGTTGASHETLDDQGVTVLRDAFGEAPDGAADTARVVRAARDHLRARVR